MLTETMARKPEHHRFNPATKARSHEKEKALVHFVASCFRDRVSLNHGLAVIVARWGPRVFPPRADADIRRRRTEELLETPVKPLSGRGPGDLRERRGLRFDAFARNEFSQDGTTVGSNDVWYAHPMTGARFDQLIRVNSQ